MMSSRACLPASPDHLLVLKPSSLGDIVHTLPAVAALRQTFPSARISWLCHPDWAPILRNSRLVDEVMEFPRRDFRGPAGWLRFLRWRKWFARRTSPDLILDFQGLLRSALVAQSFRGVPMIGLSDAREGARFFQTATVQVEKGRHSVERYLALAAAAGAKIVGSPEFVLPSGHMPSLDLPSSPFVVLHPFSRGEGKSLSAAAVESFSRACLRPVVLVGRSNESSLNLPAKVLNLLNRTTLEELLWILQHATYIVSVDSGPAHLAAAATDRLLAIHTWSDPCLVGPHRPGAHVWKGGQIFRALDPASSQAKAAEPTTADAEMMADFVNQQLAVS
jgi:ADP-heptose:LPS heptosyltransferase